MGSLSGTHLNQPVTSMVSSPDGKGYLLAAADGGVFAFGDARFYGSLGAVDLNRHIVGITSTPTGKGYWLLGANGAVYAFGDARFYGIPRQKPGHRYRRDRRRRQPRLPPDHRPGLRHRLRGRPKELRTIGGGNRGQR